MKKVLFIMFSLTIIASVILHSCSMPEQNTGDRVNDRTDMHSTSEPNDGSLDFAGSTLADQETSVDRGNGYCVCIDAGHQQKGISEKEPNGPGSDVLKAKLSSGTVGVVSKIPEYVLTLDVSLMLKKELLSRGYEVIMIRETHDCPKSNAERALEANESGADVFVRIHANGSSDPNVKGALTCAPTELNEFLSEELIRESRRLSEDIVYNLCKATGALNRGIYGTDEMTGINWCRIPVTIVEMGYMSNAEEDRLMATEDYRAKIVVGLSDGIDEFFGLRR